MILKISPKINTVLSNAPMQLKIKIYLPNYSTASKLNVWKPHHKNVADLSSTDAGIPHARERLHIHIDHNHTVRLFLLAKLQKKVHIVSFAIVYLRDQKMCCMMQKGERWDETLLIYRQSSVREKYNGKLISFCDSCMNCWQFSSKSHTHHLCILFLVATIYKQNHKHLLFKCSCMYSIHNGLA